MDTAHATRNASLLESVRNTVETTIIDVVGIEYYEECEVGLDSTLSEDIELESMEIMEIAERLIATYEGRVDFVEWFSSMELEELIELTFGDLVGFIVTSIERSDQAVTRAPPSLSKGSQRVGVASQLDNASG